jgi:hypothetical protein
VRALAYTLPKSRLSGEKSGLSSAKSAMLR